MSYSINGFEFKGAVFDLDGTLLDSVGVWREVDERFFGRRNMTIPDDFFQKISSMNFEAAAVYVKERFNLPQTTEQIIAEWFADAYDAYAHHIELKKGAFEYLKLLHESGVKLAVATASDERLYTAALKRHCIYDFFDNFTTTQETKRGKGFPDVYLLAAQRLSLDPAECVVFEDIAQGIKGAVDGGFKACAVYDIHSDRYWQEKNPPADFYIRDYSELM